MKYREMAYDYLLREEFPPAWIMDHVYLVDRLQDAERQRRTEPLDPERLP